MNTPISPPIRSFACSVIGREGSQVIAARTAGQARYRFLLDAQDWHPDLRIIDIRAVVAGAPSEPQGFRSVCRQRGVEFAKVGMRVTVQDKPGHIVGCNSSANFDVLFDGESYPLNCHPRWMMRYFADDGTELFPPALALGMLASGCGRGEA